MGRIVNGFSFAGSRGTNPIAAYAVNGLTPETVADFAAVSSNDPLFAYTGLVKTFSEMFTYTGASNKTMVDSTGLLKWAPHNWFSHSEQINDAAWKKFRCTVGSNVFAAPNGEMTADATIQASGQTTAGLVSQTRSGVRGGSKVKISAFAHEKEKPFLVMGSDAHAAAGSNTYSYFNLSTGTKGSIRPEHAATITDLGGGYYKCSIEITVRAAGGSVTGILGGADSDGTLTVTDSGGIYLWGLHFYQSDLAGMASVPLDERGLASDDTYVPTTAAARYLPRRDSYRYNGTSFVRKGLRLESEQRTNLALHSNTFSDAAWTKNTCTVTQNALGIDGETSAWTLEATSINPRLEQDFTVATTTDYTYSILVKAGTVGWVRIFPIDFTTPVSASTWFNVSDGTIGTVGAGHTARISEVADGKFLCSVTFKTDATDTDGRVFIRPVGANEAASSTIGDTVIVEHAQFEAGSVPSSRIITGAAAVTRAAETLTIAAAKMSYDSTAMWFQVQGEMDYAVGDSIFTAVHFRWRPSNDDFIECSLATGVGSSGRLQFRQRAAAGTVHTVTTPDNYLAPGVIVPFNLASRNGASYINGAEGGVALTSDTTPTALPDLSATVFQLAPTLMGHIALFRQGTGDPADVGIEEATS